MPRRVAFIWIPHARFGYPERAWHAHRTGVAASLAAICGRRAPCPVVIGAREPLGPRCRDCERRRRRQHPRQ